MHHYQKLMIGVIFILLCPFSLMLSHSIGLLALLNLPLAAILCTLIVATLIEIVYTSQHHHP